MAYAWLSRSSVALSLALGVLGGLVGAPRLTGQSFTSALQSPTFTFTTPGVHEVTLEVCNAGGCHQVTKSITVLDPTPVIDSAVVGPLIVEAGKLVRLTGSGHGQPPLGYSWSVALGTSILPGPMVAQATGTTAWWDTRGMAPGTYAVQLDLRNGVGTLASSVPALVVVVPEAGSGFYTVTPCRLLDTRQAGGALATGAVRQIAAAGGACGIPAGAEAISANVTAVGPTGQGHVMVYPGNYPRPGTSTVNFGAGQTRANGVILPLSSDGNASLAVEAVLTTGDVNLLIDVNGYFL